jgi:glycogen synthase
MLNGMGQDFSWTKQVREYEALYRLVLQAAEGTPSGSQPEA